MTGPVTARQHPALAGLSCPTPVTGLAGRNAAILAAALQVPVTGMPGPAAATGRPVRSMS